MFVCVYYCIQDASQYVLSQIEALEAEQNHIDNRAGVVERKLRQLLETGKIIFIMYFVAKDGCTINEKHMKFWVTK